MTGTFHTVFTNIPLPFPYLDSKLTVRSKSSNSVLLTYYYKKGSSNAALKKDTAELYKYKRTDSASWQQHCAKKSSHGLMICVQRLWFGASIGGLKFREGCQSIGKVWRCSRCVRWRYELKGEIKILEFRSSTKSTWKYRYGRGFKVHLPRCADYAKESLPLGKTNSKQSRERKETNTGNYRRLNSKEQLSLYDVPSRFDITSKSKQ